MTVSNTKSFTDGQVGTGLVDEYFFDFKIPNESSLNVYVVESDDTVTDLTLNTDYELKPNSINNEAGGGITLLAGNLAVGRTIYFDRSVALTQDADYRETGKFPAESHELALDTLQMQIQDLQRQINRSLRFSTTSGVLTSESAFTPIEGRAPIFNADGSLGQSNVSLGDLDTALSNAETFANAASASATAAATAETNAETAETNAEAAQAAAEDARDEAIASIGSVMVSDDDTTYDTLDNKISVDAPLEVRVENPAGNERLVIGNSYHATKVRNFVVRNESVDPETDFTFEAPDGGSSFFVLVR